MQELSSVGFSIVATRPAQIALLNSISRCMSAQTGMRPGSATRITRGSGSRRPARPINGLPSPPGLPAKMTASSLARAWVEERMLAEPERLKNEQALEPQVPRKGVYDWINEHRAQIRGEREKGGRGG